MDAREGYARRWTQKEEVEVDGTLSECIKSIADVQNVDFDD